MGDPNCLGPGSLGIEVWPVPGSDDLPHQPGECPHYMYIIYIYICLYVSIYIYICIRLFVCLSVCLSVYLSIYLPTYLPT